jgi:hypothetical protein
MKGLIFTKQTSTIALVFFTLYFSYGLFYIPTVKFLVCLAVGGIVYGITDSYEIATISLLATSLITNVIDNTHEGFTQQQVTKRIVDMVKKPWQSVKGVNMTKVEGFADAPAEPEEVVESIDGEQLAKMTKMMSKMLKGMDTAVTQAPTAKAKAKTVEPMADEATPEAESTDKDSAGLDNGGPVVTKISEQNIPAVHQPAESFQDNGGLFKLGQIPTDKKGGYHIDAGTTVMNAINALKPDQIKAMTTDTKQLIETQKSLMGMLQTFQPMVQEGKQMMDTFQTMFSPTMGAGAKM